MSIHDDYRFAMFQQCATDLEGCGKIHQRMTRKQRQDFEMWKLTTKISSDATKQQEPAPKDAQTHKTKKSRRSKPVKQQLSDDNEDDEYHATYQSTEDEDDDDYEDDLKQKKSRKRARSTPRRMQDKRPKMPAKPKKEGDGEDLEECKQTASPPQSPRILKRRTPETNTEDEKDEDMGRRAADARSKKPKKPTKPTTSSEKKKNTPKKHQAATTTAQPPKMSKKPANSSKPSKSAKEKAKTPSTASTMNPKNSVKKAPRTESQKTKGGEECQRASTKSPKKQKRPTKSKKQEADNVDDDGESVSVTPFAYPLKILPNQLVFQDDLIGEGRIGRVVTAKFGQLLVACKTRRSNQPRIQFEQRLARELEFAALLSVCRAVNQYVGVLSCKRSELVYKTPRRYTHAKDEVEHFAVQRYYKHGDLLEYVDSKNNGQLHPLEILQIAINLFSAITDAHGIGIGLVDIKRENVLIDNAGSAVLTDFGSCIRMDGAEVIMLEDTEDGVNWTDEVAAPEMIDERKFYLASDVFMGTVIVGELLMSPMKSGPFQSQVLRRQRNRGAVDFQSDMIPLPYRAFCPLLQKGFHNDPRERLTAAMALNFLEQLHDASFGVSMKLQLPVLSNEYTFNNNHIHTSDDMSIQEDEEDTDACMADQSPLSSTVSSKGLQEFDGSDKWPTDPECFTLAPMDREEDIQDLRVMHEADLNRSDGCESRNSSYVTAEDSIVEPEEDQVQVIQNARHIVRRSPTPFDSKSASSAIFTKSASYRQHTDTRTLHKYNNCSKRNRPKQ